MEETHYLMEVENPQMIIKSLFITRKGADTPELIEAWDEYTIDGYPEGFDEACDKALASIGSDLVQWRIIDIEVPYNAVEAAFQPVKIGVS